MDFINWDAVIALALAFASLLAIAAVAFLAFVLVVVGPFVVASLAATFGIRHGLRSAQSDTPSDPDGSMTP